MIRNLLLASWRSIQKNTSSSLINFIGLVFGFICILIIGIYIHHELSYDRHHENVERIYRVTHNEKAGEIPGIRHLATVGPPLGPALKNFTQVEDAVRFRHSPNRVMRANDHQHYENLVFYVDPSVFHIFSFPLLKGDAKTALSLPNNVVITSDMATKYFGDNDPMGKTIVVDNTTNLIVTGVLAPLPTNLHMKFDFLIPFEGFQVPHGYPVTLTSWGWISFHTYLLLKPGESADALERRLVDLVKSNWPEERAKKFKLQLQPLSEIYLGDVQHEDIASGNNVYIVVLAIAGCLILLIAGFNFANLYTVISITRAKEMGIRNVMGAKKTFIAFYLIAEAIGMAVIAALVATLALPPAIRYINTIGFEITVINFYTVLTLAIAMAVATGLLASLYPAFMLSSLHHQQLLKGSFRTSPRGILVRRSLVFIQFCITIALISSVWIIQSQINFIGKKDLGYAKDELLILRMPGESLAQRFPTIKAQLAQNPQVIDVSLGGGRMDGENGNVPIYPDGNLEEGVPMAIDAATFDFFRTIDTPLIAGREISERQPSDTLHGVLLNESALKTFGWSPDEAIGKKIRVGDIVIDGEVIGIIPDFNFGLLRSPIQPLVMYFPRTHLQDIYVRFQGGSDKQALLTSIEQNWKIAAPEFPLDFTFLGEYLNSLYISEKFFFMLFKLFAVAAILISCLGLFALISQDVVFRVKEIGIRKTLGASVSNILLMIVQPFVLLIVLAGLLATPLSWWGMRNWLNEFSYHTSIEGSVFVWAVVTTLTIALATISYKAIQASLVNPVKSLRSE
ncbi:MAG TPA: ABC transporter permease [Chryseolinea sp.]|nr:ABC transporter permease [Chryseolinea sp.]